MTRILVSSALALTLIGGTAQAQSYMAPAGIPADTAPGFSAGADLSPNLSATPRGYQSLPAGSTVRHRGRAYRR